MVAIIAKQDGTIEDIVKGLVNEASENNYCPNIIANFADKSNLNSRFADIGHSEGEVYDITLAAEIGSIVKEIVIQLNYRVSKYEGKLVGNYTDQDNKGISKERLSAIIMHPLLPESVKVRLKEVGFTPPGKKRELLYREKYHENMEIYSKLGYFISNMKEGLSRIGHSLYSNEPSMKKQFNSSTLPWLVWGTIFTAASAASSVVVQLIYKHYFK